MCYTIEKNLTREQLEKRFGAKFKPNRPYSPGKRVSAFSLPNVPVIKSTARGEITTLVWGLIPFWVKDREGADQIRMKTFNARAETLLQKPSFKHTIKSHRCLVLTNGYYEWQHQSNEKIPYFISLKDDIAMPLAGLYDQWVDHNTGEIIEGFTIITTKANFLLEKIHNTKKRMPVILTGEDEEKWLNSFIEASMLEKILTPLDESLIDVKQVDKKMFQKRETRNSQGSLF